MKQIQRSCWVEKTVFSIQNVCTKMEKFDQSLAGQVISSETTKGLMNKM